MCVLIDAASKSRIEKKLAKGFVVFISFVSGCRLANAEASFIWIKEG
jgi:hypothetical protein